jgi:hypothetical protein
MNERIVKLISEADAHARSIADKYSPDSGEVSYLWEDAFRKKFAELIVQECAYIVENSPWQLRRGYKAIDQANLVKQHFGVKS